MTVFSKWQIVHTSCKDYVHPWSESCFMASASLLKPCITESLRIYVTAYMAATLMRGKLPNRPQLVKMFFDIIRSCIFLICHGIGFSAAVCLLRKIFGRFTFLSVAFLPSFVSSVVAILIERPSRRSLLSLYVTNVATETLFKMAVSRNLVRPMPYGEVAMFAPSFAFLLYAYRCNRLPKDPVYTLLKFLIGTYEQVPADHNEVNKLESEKSWGRQTFNRVERHSSCPHPFTCDHYVFQGASRNFLVGFVVQLVLKIALNAKKFSGRPSQIAMLPIQISSYNLAAFFGSCTSVYRGLSCYLRRKNGRDDKKYAIPAGLLAGLAFIFFRDSTIARYFMWKAFQVAYNIGVEKGYCKEIPYAPVFFHAFSTAVLFHVAILEPLNLRPSYWRFLYNMSGTKIAKMERKTFDVFGLNSTQQLKAVLNRDRKM